MRAKDIIPASKPRNFVAKNQKTAGAGAHRDKKKEQKQGYEKHRGKSVAEGYEELRDSLLNVLQTIYKGAASGENMIDVLADELNQYYDEIDQSGDATLQQVYSYMMDNGQEAEDDPNEMAKIARTAISMLNQEEGSVMEYETHRYTDDQGNEWEVNDEGDKTLIKRGWGGGSSRSYNRPPRYQKQPTMGMKKGMYFYNVQPGQENDAKAAGLKQSKGGKWYSPGAESPWAEKKFGKGRYWEPK